MKYALMNLLADAAATTATTDAAAATETMGTGATIIYYAVQFVPMILIFVVFYFLLIRPENKRKKQAQAMRDSLKKGDMITTIGGIVGKIVMVNPNTIVIETSDDRVRMELTKWAVSQVGVQTGEQPEAEKKEKKTEKKEETPAVEAPKADEDEKN